MKLIIKLSILCGACLVGWWIGGQLNTDAITLLLGVILGLMVSIPFALMISASKQNEQKNTEQPQRTVAPITALTVRPTRYVVVEPSVQRLPGAGIEVQR